MIIRYFRVYIFIIGCVILQSCKNDDFIKIKKSDLMKDVNIIVNENEFKKEKHYNLAIVVPMSGIYKNIGQEIVDSIMLCLYKNKNKNISINIIDSGSNKDKLNWNALKILENLKPDVVIGPLFYSHHEEIENLKLNSYIFSLSNTINSKINKSNLIISGYSNLNSLDNIINFVKSSGRQNIAIISDINDYEKGNIVMNLKKIISNNDLNLIDIEYFDKTNELSYDFAIKKISSKYKTIIYLDENDNVINYNIKNKSKIKNDNKEKNIAKKTQYRLIDVIYINGNIKDIEKIMMSLDSNNMTDKDIIIIIDSSAILKDNNFDMKIKDNIFFSSHVINKDSNGIDDEFFKNFLYKRKENVSNVSYDISSMLFYLIEKDALTDDNIYSLDGFIGILGKFRFNKYYNNIERVYNIYRIRGRTSEIVKNGEFRY